MKKLLLIGVFVLLFVSCVSAVNNIEIEGFLGDSEDLVQFVLDDYGHYVEGSQGGEPIISMEILTSQQLTECMVDVVESEGDFISFIQGGSEEGSYCIVDEQGNVKVYFNDHTTIGSGVRWYEKESNFNMYSILPGTEAFLEAPYELVRVNVPSGSNFPIDIGGLGDKFLTISSEEYGGEFSFWLETRNMGEGEDSINVLAFELGERVVIQTTEELSSTPLIVNGYALTLGGDTRIEYTGSELKVTLNYEEEEECLGGQAKNVSLSFEEASVFLSGEEREVYSISQNMCNTEVYMKSNDKTYTIVYNGDEKVSSGIKVVSNANNNKIFFNLKKPTSEKAAGETFLLSNEDELNLVFIDSLWSSVVVNDDHERRVPLQVCGESFNFEGETTLGKNTMIFFDMDFVESETTGGMPDLVCNFYTANFEYNAESVEGGYQLGFVTDYPQVYIDDINSLGPHTTDGDYILNVLYSSLDGGYQGWWKAKGSLIETEFTFLNYFNTKPSDSGLAIGLSDNVIISDLEGFEELSYDDEGHHGIKAESFKIGNVGFVPNNGLAHVYLGTEGFNVEGVDLEGVDLTGAVVSNVEDDNRVVSFFGDLTDLITGQAVDDIDYSGDVPEFEDDYVDQGDSDEEQEERFGEISSDDYERGINENEYADYSGYFGGGSEDILTEFEGSEFVALTDISSALDEDFVGDLDPSNYIAGEDVTVVMPYGGHVYNYETGNKYVLKEGVYNLYVKNSNLELIDCCSGGTKLAANLDMGVFHVGCVSGKGRYDRYKQFTESVGTYKLDTSSTCAFTVEDEDALVEVVDGDDKGGKVDSELGEDELKEEFLNGCERKEGNWGCDCVRRTVDLDGTCVGKSSTEGLWTPTECNKNSGVCDSDVELCWSDNVYCCADEAQGVKHNTAHKNSEAFAFDISEEGYVCKRTGRVYETEGIAFTPVDDALADVHVVCSTDSDCGAGSICDGDVCVSECIGEVNELYCKSANPSGVYFKDENCYEQVSVECNLGTICDDENVGTGYGSVRSTYCVGSEICNRDRDCDDGVCDFGVCLSNDIYGEEDAIADEVDSDICESDEDCDSGFCEEDGICFSEEEELEDDGLSCTPNTSYCNLRDDYSYVWTYNANCEPENVLCDEGKKCTVIDENSAECSQVIV
jgi:hypothetical protein